MTIPAPAGCLLSVFSKGGHDVKAAGSGIEALAAVRGEDFDIVLMDIHMPDMSGIETARLIRKNISPARNSEMAILAFSSGAGHAAGDFEKAGINGCIEKPINPQLLLELIDQYERERERRNCP